MKCTEFKDEIHAFLRGQLEPERASEVDEHMRECEHCKEFLEFASDLTCQQFIDFLNDYVDDKLEPNRRQVFENHLGICQDCRDYLDSYRKMMNLSALALGGEGGLVPKALPEDLIKAILAARER